MLTVPDAATERVRDGEAHLSADRAMDAPGAMPALGQNFKSTSTSNRAGLKSAAMDAGIKAFTAAKTDTEKKAATKTIQEPLNADLPFLPYAAIEECVVWGAGIQGLAFNHSTVVFFDKAWIKK